MTSGGKKPPYIVETFFTFKGCYGSAFIHTVFIDKVAFLSKTWAGLNASLDQSDSSKASSSAW